MSSPESQFTGENQEREITETTLALVEKDALADAWHAMVMDTGQRPLDVSDWDNNKMREWLNVTLRQDVANLVDDWKLAPTEEMADQLQNALDVKHKSALENGYLSSLMGQLYHLGRAGERSGKWESYPKLIRQSDSMNCVAKSLLAKELLDRANIDSHIANPAGHAMNVVRLADGGYVFFDASSGINKRIEPHIRDMEGVTVLEVNDPSIKYRLLPLLDEQEYAQPIIGNFGALQNEMQDPRKVRSREGREKAEHYESQELYRIFRTEFAATDWGEVWEKLYPQFARLDASQDMQAESKRVGEFEAAFESVIGEIEAHLATMSDPEVLMRIRAELGGNLEGIRSYLSAGDRGVLEKLGNDSNSMVESLKGRLDALKQHNLDVAKEVTDYLLVNWKRFKE